MIRQLFSARRRRILVDVDSQNDYFLANGGALVGNHRRILARIRRVMAWARHNRVSVISTCQVYPKDNVDSSINFCIDGTEGQRKIGYTLMRDRVSFAADNHTDLPEDVMRRYRQVILHKRSVNPFDEPRIERLLSEVRAAEFIVIGAVTESAVAATVLGLRQRGRKVTVLLDAIGSRNKKQADMALRKMRAKGARFLETRALAGRSHLDAASVRSRPMVVSTAEPLR